MEEQKEKNRTWLSQQLLEENMMGPSSVVILEELLKQHPLRPGMRVLDLGCGKGLTSLFLAKEYGVQVFAVDLWIPAEENLQRFREMGLEDQIIPIHADAHALPFAKGYFDAVVSVDSYHYFGNCDTYLQEYLLPFLQDGAAVALAFPGMKREVLGNVPEEMAPYWEEEALQMWHSIDWWKPKMDKGLQDVRIWEMACFEKAWKDWLSTNNPYAIGDRAMMEADGGRFMNLVAITGKKAGEPA